MLATQTKRQQGAEFLFPTTADLMALCRAEGPCLSILLAPHRAGSGTRSSATELLGMLPKIATAMEKSGIHPGDAAAMREALEKLAAEPSLQDSHSGALCLYCTSHDLACFSARAVVETGWHLEERFVVGPILAHLDYRQSFALLALAGKHIRLLRSDGGRPTKLSIPEGVPESVAEFMHEDRDTAHGKNHAFGVRFGSENGREKSGHFRQDFMKAIDRGLRPVLRELGLPLVLAGVDEETAAFTAVSDYPHLLPEPVQTSPDGGITDPELAQAGVQILKRWSNAAEKQALAEYQHAGPGRHCLEGNAIISEAGAGKVQHLFVARGAVVSGRDDAVNAAMVAVLLHKGLVWLLEPEQVPEAVVMAAVLRYAGDKTGE
jgi:hypothetical protein